MRSAASRRSILAFEERPHLSDGFGNTRARDFAESFRVRGSIRPKLGGEEVTASRLAGRQPSVIEVRSSDETRRVDESWRIRDITNGGTIYNIRSKVDVMQRDRWIEFLCDSGKAVAT